MIPEDVDFIMLVGRLRTGAGAGHILGMHWNMTRKKYINPKSTVARGVQRQQSHIIHFGGSHLYQAVEVGRSKFATSGQQRGGRNIRWKTSKRQEAVSCV
jgi:hypothetical protein